MKKKIFLLLISFVFALTLAGSGEKQVVFAQESAIEITTSMFLEIGKTRPMNGHYKLTEDIDLTNVNNFLPIGLKIVDDEQEITPFTGSFDGNGHTIKGLNFNKDQEIYNFGLFAHLFGAEVINLNLTDVKIENNVVFSQQTTNSKTIIAGSVAAVAENCVVENVQVSFATVSTSTLIAAGRADFGGLFGRALYGTKIKNSFVKADFNFELDTIKLQNFNAGLLAGVLNSSKVQNTIVTGDIALKQLNNDASHGSVLNIGGNAGYVLGSQTEMISTYSNISFNLQNFNLESFPEENFRIGALVGTVSDQLHSVPEKGSISYNVMISKILISSLQIDFDLTFGDLGQYDKTTSVYNFLTKDNYEIFKNTNENKYYWSPYESYTWNTKTVWLLSAVKLPSLQVFSNYMVKLNIEKTSVSLAQATRPEDLIVMAFEFESGLGQNTTETFAYGKKVKVAIALKNNFDIYYSLESVQLNSATVISLGQTSPDYELVSFEQEGEVEDPQVLPAIPYENTTKVYVFSFLANNQNSGEISVTLSKVVFDLEVKTEDVQKGMVRRRQAPTMVESLPEKISVANTYEYVAVPSSTNFAFDKWVIETEDELGMPIQIDLEQAGQFSLISFAFGKSDTTSITENILNKGKLVALFTNNVTKITFIVEESKAGENTKAGNIYNHDRSQEFKSSEVVSFIKGREVTFVAKEIKGYKFIGWYDGQNRLREEGTSFTYLTNQDEDEITFSAVFEKESVAASLSTLWIILGAIGGGGIIAAVVIILVRKGRDNSYKNFY